MMMVEGLNELDAEQEAAPEAAPAPAPEMPAAMGQRLADAAFPTSYRIDKRKLEGTVRKLISRRVRLPRAQASDPA